MKKLNTPIMRKMLAAALRKIRRNKIRPPSDGMLIPVIDRYTRRGKWQVEYIHDQRFARKPYLTAFFFKGQGMHCRPADYYLTKVMD